MANADREGPDFSTAVRCILDFAGKGPECRRALLGSEGLRAAFEEPPGSGDVRLHWDGVKTLLLLWSEKSNAAAGDPGVATWLTEALLAKHVGAAFALEEPRPLDSPSVYSVDIWPTQLPDALRLTLLKPLLDREEDRERKIKPQPLPKLLEDFIARKLIRVPNDDENDSLLKVELNPVVRGPLLRHFSSASLALTDVYC